MSQVIERYALIFNEKWAGLTIHIVQLVAEIFKQVFANELLGSGCRVCY